MDKASKSLTNEWVSEKIQDTNQFDVVNYLIRLAKQKVQRGEADEFNSKNIAVEVLHDVATDRQVFNDVHTSSSQGSIVE